MGVCAAIQRRGPIGPIAVSDVTTADRKISAQRSTSSLNPELVPRRRACNEPSIRRHVLNVNVDVARDHYMPVALDWAWKRLGRPPQALEKI